MLCNVFFNYGCDYNIISGQRNMKRTGKEPAASETGSTRKLP